MSFTGLVQGGRTGWTKIREGQRSGNTRALEVLEYPVRLGKCRTLPRMPLGHGCTRSFWAGGLLESAAHHQNELGEGVGMKNTPKRELRRPGSQQGSQTFIAVCLSYT